MYKIKTTKQAFDLINDIGEFDEPFVVHEANAFDMSFNVAGLISILDAKTADALLKGKADEIDYKQLVKSVVDSGLYKDYCALDLRKKNIVKEGFINRDEFGDDQYGNFVRKRDVINTQVVVDSTEMMQTLIDTGLLTQTDVDGDYRYLAMPGLIKDVDFNLLTEPFSDAKARFYVDYSTLVNCKASNDVKIAWSNLVGCQLGDNSVLSQNNITSMRNDRPTIIGENAQILNCSADNSTIGANSLVFSMQRCPIVNCDIGDNCDLIGGTYRNNKYGHDVRVDVPSSDVVKEVFSGEHLQKRRQGRAYWKTSPITSEADLAGSTIVIFPRPLNNIDNMIQFTNSANREIKSGTIGGSVSVAIDGQVPGAFHGHGADIRARYRQDYLDSQDGSLTMLLEQSKEVISDHVEKMFKLYFGLESKVDMFDDTGGDPVYKNKELINTVVERICGGFKDTLLNSRSHKDISNDHKFATDVVSMVKEEVAASYKLTSDELTARGHQFKLNMERTKRLLKDIVDVVPALNEFNLIRTEQSKELAEIGDELSDAIGYESSYEEIQEQLSGDIYDSDGVRIIDEAGIYQIQTANGQEDQMDLFGGAAQEHHANVDGGFDYDDEFDEGLDYDQGPSMSY